MAVLTQYIMLWLVQAFCTLDLFPFHTAMVSISVWFNEDESLDEFVAFLVLNADESSAEKSKRIFFHTWCLLKDVQQERARFHHEHGYQIRVHVQSTFRPLSVWLDELTLVQLLTTKASKGTKGHKDEPTARRIWNNMRLFLMDTQEDRVRIQEDVEELQFYIQLL
jgi:hypothetical protein